MFSARKKLIFAAATCAFLLCSVEGALRILQLPSSRRAPVEIFDRWVKSDEAKGKLQFDRELFWKGVPGAAVPILRDPLNARGFRGPDFTIQKKKGTKRIVVLGDSSSFGWGAAEDATFARRIEAILNLTNEKEQWEVVNLSVPAYSLYQMERLFVTFGADLAPDIVLIYAGAWNDLVPGVDGPDSAVAARLNNGVFSKLSNHSRIFAFFSSLAGARAPSPPAGDADFRARVERGDRRVPMIEFKELYHRLAARVSYIGAKALLIIPGISNSLRKDFPQTLEYTDAVDWAARAQRALLVDGRNALELEPNADLINFSDAMHPTERGHALLAYAILQKLSEARVVSFRSSNLIKWKEPRVRSLFDEFAAAPMTLGSPSDRRADGRSFAVDLPASHAFNITNIAAGPNVKLLFGIGYFGEGAPPTLQISAGGAGETPRPLAKIPLEALNPGAPPPRHEIALPPSPASLNFYFEVSPAPGRAVWVRPEIVAIP